MCTAANKYSFAMLLLHIAPGAQRDFGRKNSFFNQLNVAESCFQRTLAKMELFLAPLQL